MRYLVRLMPTGQGGEAFLDSTRSVARAVGADPRNPKWTSYGALELDIFAPTKKDLDLFLSAMGPLCTVEFSRDLNEAPKHQAEGDLLAEARSYFNAERFWECHEVLEGLWRVKTGEEKRFLQGVILICAAFVHHQKGEDQVGLGVLRRAVNQLDFPTKTYGGMDVTSLRSNAEHTLETKKFSLFEV
ncbi:MAG: DUF309 domain-containing protein [Thaumarchaeota archaeon]|nr:DUF309 domain-containing protein [Nitrososphaerota archaeon]